MSRKRDDIADRRYTLMWVPQGGRGRVRQLTITMRQLRWVIMGVVVALALSVSAVTMMGASLPRSQACDSLLEQNLTLKSRLQDIERTMGEVEDQLRRLRMYDQQLQELRREGFSGYGPVEDDEADPSLFADEEEAVADADVDPVTGGGGEPMHALDGMELAPVFMGPVDAWSHDVRTQAEHLLSLAQAIEPQVGLMVESAEDSRAPPRGLTPRFGPQREASRPASAIDGPPSAGFEVSCRYRCLRTSGHEDSRILLRRGRAR